MSEPIPESIPTSADRRSRRPTKKRALTPSSQQADQVEALFANPDREIHIPSGPVAKRVAAPPEIVANVQGSSAGAGSGEFHVYKASRRREYERLKVMDEEVAREQADQDFTSRQDERKQQDQEKLDKNRAKREKAKLRKQKAQHGVADQQISEPSPTTDAPIAVEVKKKKKLGSAKVARPDGDEQNGTGAIDEPGSNGVEEVGITIHDDD